MQTQSLLSTFLDIMTGEVKCVITQALPLRLSSGEAEHQFSTLDTGW